MGQRSAKFHALRLADFFANAMPDIYSAQAPARSECTISRLSMITCTDRTCLVRNAPKWRFWLALLHCSASYADWAIENTYFCFVAHSKRSKS